MDIGIHGGSDNVGVIVGADRVNRNSERRNVLVYDCAQVPDQGKIKRT